MRRFAALYEQLDATTKTSAKVEAMVEYLRQTPPEDAAWAVFFLTGRRLKRLISGRVLRAWAGRVAGLPEWLLDDAHAAVGDSAETAALLVDGEDQPDAPPLALHRWLEERILLLRDQPAEHQYAVVTAWWRELPRNELFVLNKLLTGALRVGVSNLLLVRALASLSGLPPAIVTHRLMGHCQPTAAWYRGLIAAERRAENGSRPYPFYLASRLEQAPETLGALGDWLVEWKWDGIRAQLIRRGGCAYLWSRGEELITERFPEIVGGGDLPDGLVLDGEVLAWGDAGVLPFAALQKRIGRDRLTPQIMAAAPARFLAYDLLEADGVDLRPLPLASRRARLLAVAEASGGRIEVSPEVVAGDWPELGALRDEARARRVEGLMLKRRESAYGSGRQRGAWWKWKADPLTVDAVLIYAEAGSGRRANLFTDYTFGVWQGQALVPVAKAYSGLDDEEIARLDHWIRRHTLERFGPVRSVEPVHVFEIAFESVSPSSRHKSGLALRFPRILRWRADKPAAEADRLEHVRALIPAAIRGD